MRSWMIVEDEPGLYEMMLVFMQNLGIHGYPFTDGEAAIAWLDDVDAGLLSPEPPQIAVIDIRLPGIQGPSVAARLRTSPVLGNIPIMLMTGYVLSPAEKEHILLVSGADYFMKKPLPRWNQFTKIIDELILKRSTPLTP